MGLEIMTIMVFLGLSIILFSVLFVSLCVYFLMSAIYYDKICKKIDACPKIKMLKDHDWACDYQLASTMREICDKCKEMES